MDWIRALENEKKSVCVENSTDKTDERFCSEVFSNPPDGPFSYETHLANAIKSLNDAGTSPMDIPKEKRHAAFALEPEIHKAVDEGRKTNFLNLVDKYIKIFEGNMR